MGRAAGRKPSDPQGGREAGTRTAVPTLHTGAEAGRDGLVNSEDPPTGVCFPECVATTIIAFQNFIYQARLFFNFSPIL